MPSDSPVTNNVASSKTLAVCWLLYGVLRLAMAVWLVSFTPIATVMFGALLVRVADPFNMMSAFHLFYTFAIVLSAVCGIIGLLAGLALLSGWRAGRILALIAGFLSLSELPLGITLGVYTLIVLLPQRSARESQTL
jgi:uncharacterized membrane protein